MPLTQFTTTYREADIRIEVEDLPAARLFINNIQRQHQEAAAIPCSFRLSSTVQTDYEWHEFIEAIIHLTPHQISVTLLANNIEILREVITHEVINEPG